MFRSLAIRLFVLCTLVPLIAFAQGKATQPGPPSTAPKVVVDANGKTVGPVVDLITGYQRALVNFTAANGSNVILSAVSGGLNGTVTLQPSASTPQQASVFFTTADCSGDAYVSLAGAAQPSCCPFPPSVSTFDQLMPNQSLTIDFLIFSPPAPPPPGSCFALLSAPGHWLYIASSSACPVQSVPTPLTFAAYYGLPFGPNGACAPAAITVPNSTIPLTVFRVYKRVEDLNATFTPPFSIQ